MQYSTYVPQARNVTKPHVGAARALAVMLTNRRSQMIINQQPPTTNIHGDHYVRIELESAANP